MASGSASKKNREKTRAEKLKAAQKAHSREDNMKKIIFGICGLLIFGLIFGLIAWAVASRPESVKSEQLTPKYITQDGSFPVLPDGGVNTSWSKENDKTRLQIFLDPQCPACGIVDRAIGNSLNELNKNNETDLYINVVGFLDNASTDRYSTRAAQAVVTVAENDPKNFMKFITEIYKIENQPHEGINYISVTNDDLAEMAKDAGVSDLAAEKIKSESYRKWIEDNTAKQLNRQDIFKEGFSTPSIFIGGSSDDNGVVKDAKRLQLTNLDTMEEDFTKAVKEGK